MSFESNNGSIYYQLSCGVPTVSGWNANSNNDTKYLYLSANDFVLWGQSTIFIHPSSNNTTNYYFLVCQKPTDTNWSPLSNNSTNFYYNSAYNCISFCN
jgi:hypothetical protein